MEQREVRLLNHSCPHATASQFSRFATESATLFFTGTDAASDSACEETKKPIKKRPLQDMRESTFLLEQEHRFEHMINAFEGLHALDVDPEVETFTNGLAYSLNKTSGFQHAKLFKEINDLVYDTMFLKCTTTPRPPQIPHLPPHAKPHLGAFRPPCPVSTPSAPTVHSDSVAFSNWGMHVNPPTFQMDGSGSGDMTRTLQYEEL